MASSLLFDKEKRNWRISNALYRRTLDPERKLQEIALADRPRSWDGELAVLRFMIIGLAASDVLSPVCGSMGAVILQQGVAVIGYILFKGD